MDAMRVKNTKAVLPVIFEKTKKRIPDTITVRGKRYKDISAEYW